MGRVTVADVDKVLNSLNTRTIGVTKIYKKRGVEKEYIVGGYFLKKLSGQYGLCRVVHCSGANLLVIGYFPRRELRDRMLGYNLGLVDGARLMKEKCPPTGRA